jgi:FkbM family methyltransferase
MKLRTIINYWRYIVGRGNSIKDKVNLLCIFLIIPLPHLICLKCPSLVRLRERLRTPIYLRTKLNIDGCLYGLIDTESLKIVTKAWEPYLHPFFQQLSKDQIFVDVGAHIGKYTIWAARACKLVIAIEPMPLNYLVLLNNVKLNGYRNVIALNLATWDKVCKIPLYIAPPWLMAHHSLKKDFGLGYVEVHAKPLDIILEELNVPRVDLIKIDVEGAEYETLKGSIKTLRRFSPKLIVEVGKSNASKVRQLLYELGYIMQEIKGSEFSEGSYYLAGAVRIS